MIRNPDFDADVRESFARQGMLRTLGAHIARLEHGEVWLAADLTPALTQQDGFGHAGLAWTLGDSATGYAALSVMEKGNRVLTAEMKINLLRPTTGTRVVAEGRVLRAGKSLVTVQGDVFAEDGDGNRLHVAVMLGTMARVAG